MRTEFTGPAAPGTAAAPGRRWSRTGAAGAFVVLLALASGCGLLDRDRPAGPTWSGAAPAGTDPNRYGSAPSPDADVTYQPDVVFVGGGPAAIRAASADGLTWLLDGKAPGVDRLAVDKVLYASSLAVGRIVQLRPEGDQVAVTLAPVRLGEVIRNGRLKVSQPLDLSGWGLQQVPELPGAVASLAPEASGGPSATPTPADGGQEPTPTGAGPAPTTDGSGQPAPDPAVTSSPIAMPVVNRLPARRLPPVPLPAPFTQGSAPWSAGDWSGQVDRNSGDVTFHVEHAGEGLKAYVDVGFHFASPHLDADLGIVDGEVGDAEIRLRGLREVTLDIRAGSANGLSDNLKQKVEIPVSLNAPVIVGGVAMNLNVRFKFLAQTAFTAKNSTIEASGAWTTEGPLSYDRTSGKVQTDWPTITEKKSIIDSLSGVSVGVNGFVFATEMRVMLGLGVPAVNAGPYARLVTSVGLTVGSDLGIVKCRQATVTVTAGTGIALSMSDTIAAGINQVFSRLGATRQVEEDNNKQILEQQVYQNSFWAPQVQACTLR